MFYILNKSLEKADDIQPILNHLVDYGYLTVTESGAYTGKGRPPAQTYIVNPLIYESDLSF